MISISITVLCASMAQRVFSLKSCQAKIKALAEIHSFLEALGVNPFPSLFS